MKSALVKKNGLIWQLILLSMVATIFACFNGWPGCKSTLLGGSAWLIPNLYFMGRVNQAKMIFNPRKVLKLFFLGEAIKMLLSFSIVTLILLTCTIDIWGFLGGYSLIILTSLLAPWGHGIKHG